MLSAINNSLEFPVVNRFGNVTGKRTVLNSIFADMFPGEPIVVMNLKDEKVITSEMLNPRKIGRDEYQFDLYSGSFVKRRQFLGVRSPLLDELVNFDEALYYAGRAYLINGSSALGKGDLQMKIVKDGTVFTIGSETLMVKDGCGFIRQSRVADLDKSRQHRKVYSTDMAMNYSTVQFLPEDEVVITALVNAGRELIEFCNSKENLYQLPDLKEFAELLRLAPEFIEHPYFQQRIRTVFARIMYYAIIGGESLQQFVGIPCADEEGVQTGRDLGQPVAAVGRYPMDKPNWFPTQVAYSEFLSEFESIQHTMNGMVNGVRKFFKGQLIVVPDEFFPAGLDVIMSQEDCKLSNDWTCEADVKAEKKREYAVMFSGYLGVVQWAAPGMLAKVPSSVAKFLGGDWDFDLYGFMTNAPLLKTIVSAFDQNVINPKVNKTFTFPKQSN